MFRPVPPAYVDTRGEQVCVCYCICPDIYKNTYSTPRHAVGEAVLQFCMHLFTSGKHQLEWFEALPLVHFLKGSSKPFAQLPSPNQLQWVYGFLQQQTVGKYEIE